MADTKTFVKRLQTIQNMTDTAGVKELCELLMDYLEEKDKQEAGFKNEKTDNNR